MEKVDIEKISLLHQKMLSQAEEAWKRAYCPYSHFAVGAALATDDEKIFLGANVENAAYGSTICAERAALCSANANGYRNFTNLVLIAGYLGDYSTIEPVMPCGACRQMLAEFASLYGRDLVIISATLGKDKIVSTTIKELLPYAFGPADMGFRCKA